MKSRIVLVGSLVGATALGLLLGCGDQEEESSPPIGADADRSDQIAQSEGSQQNATTGIDAESGAAPAESDAELPLDAPGLAVGEQAPKFELPDQQGQLHSLAALLEAGPTALVFYRSADW